VALAAEDYFVALMAALIQPLVDWPWQSFWNGGISHAVHYSLASQ